MEETPDLVTTNQNDQIKTTEVPAINPKKYSLLSMPENPTNLIKIFFVKILLHICDCLTFNGKATKNYYFKRIAISLYSGLVKRFFLLKDETNLGERNEKINNYTPSIMPYYDSVFL